MLRPSRKRQAVRIGLGLWIGAFGVGGLIWGVWPLAVSAGVRRLAVRDGGTDRLPGASYELHDRAFASTTSSAAWRSTSAGRGRGPDPGQRERLQLHRGGVGVLPAPPQAGAALAARHGCWRLQRSTTACGGQADRAHVRLSISWLSGRIPCSRNTIVGVDGQSWRRVGITSLRLQSRIEGVRTPEPGAHPDTSTRQCSAARGPAVRRRPRPAAEAGEPGRRCVACGEHGGVAWTRTRSATLFMRMSGRKAGAV